MDKQDELTKRLVEELLKILYSELLTVEQKERTFHIIEFLSE